MAIKSTRLRSFVSKDLEKLLAAVDGLSFKIETKYLDFQKNKWYLVFVLPEIESPALDKMELVVNLD